MGGWDVSEGEEVFKQMILVGFGKFPGGEGGVVGCEVC